MIPTHNLCDTHTHTHSCPTHLVGEQHHDGVAAGAGRCVLDGEGVVVVADDVEVDVRLGRAHHSGSTLDPDADVP